MEDDRHSLASPQRSSGANNHGRLPAFPQKSENFDKNVMV